MVSILLFTAGATLGVLVFLQAMATHLTSTVQNNRSTRYTAEADAGIDRTVREVNAMSLVALNACTDYVPDDGVADYEKNPCIFEETYAAGGGQERYLATLIPTPGKEKLQPPAVIQGYYTIISQTFEPNGRLVRKLEQDVMVSLLNMPIGVFAHNISGGGTPDIYTESVFTDGDFKGRSKVTFVGEDNYYGGPASVKAVGTIFDKSNGTDPIHGSSPVNCSYPYDRDMLGGVVPAGSCPAADPPPLENSHYSLDDLYQVVDPGAPDLSEDHYREMREVAISTGTLYTVSSHTVTVQEGDIPASLPSDTIFYFEFTSGSASSNEVNWKLDYGVCGQSNGIIVVRNGSLRLNSNIVWNGAIFIPDAGGELRGNGTATVNGTIWMDTMGSTGTITFQLPDCWLANVPSALTTLTLLDWRMIDV